MKRRDFDVSVSCQEPFAAFGEWSAFVAFRRCETGFTVFAQEENGEICIVETVSGELTIQAVCDWLLKNDEVALWGDFRDSVEVNSGIGGEDLITLAWLREHDFQSAARWLLKLPTESAGLVRDDVGSLDSDEVLSAIQACWRAGGE